MKFYKPQILAVLSSLHRSIMFQLSAFQNRLSGVSRRVHVYMNINILLLRHIRQPSTRNPITDLVLLYQVPVEYL